MKLFLVTALFLMFSTAAYAGEPLTGDIIDTHAQKIGTAELKQTRHGVLLTIDAKLPEGVHAMHIHEHAACDAPEFKTAGGHLNPDKHTHGIESAKGRHAGDLPNLYVESTGHIKAEVFLGERSKWPKQGAAVIIHEKADDYSTDPTGNAGGRIACARL